MFVDANYCLVGVVNLEMTEFFEANWGMSAQLSAGM